MIRHITEPATASGRFPYGVPVLLCDGRASAAPIGAANGVAKRPHRAGSRTHADDGDELQICTEGGLLAEVDGYARWVTVAAGHVSERAPS